MALLHRCCMLQCSLSEVPSTSGWGRRGTGKQRTLLHAAGAIPHKQQSPKPSPFSRRPLEYSAFPIHHPASEQSLRTSFERLERAERPAKKKHSAFPPRHGVCSAAVSEGEFGTAHGVVKGLFDRYRRVVEDGYRNNLKEFATAGVVAYTLGWTEEGLRKEMNAHFLPDAQRPLILPSLGSVPLDGAQLAPEGNSTREAQEPGSPEGDARSTSILDTSSTSGDGTEALLNTRNNAATSTTLTEMEKEIEECLLWLSLVFVTVLCIPGNAGPIIVKRWSTSSPVSPDSLLQWRGFCSLIANAYYNQGMAWYSIQRLQMEQMVVTGRAEPSALVADRMRLIFTTLEVVDPRWGGLKDYPTL